jgi:glucan 1,3-beta-glucosidase
MIIETRRLKTPSARFNGSTLSRILAGALTLVCALSLAAYSGLRSTGDSTSPASANVPEASAAKSADATASAMMSTGSLGDDLDPDHNRRLREPLSLLQQRGTQWVDERGREVILKGTNLGNWLLLETWMMGQSGDECQIDQTLTDRFGAAEKERLMDLYRDSWITERDWDLMAAFGLNVVRLPFRYTLLEDDAAPMRLRNGAWQYLDRAIEAAEKRGMYVILDLHGTAGSQGREQHSGCSGRNWFWDGGNGQPAEFYQARTTWLWQQIAQRYKDRKSVAAYGTLNEPWGTDAATLAAYVENLYHAIRAVDPKHIIILPGHNSGIAAYGDPNARGLSNVAFEMHFYPGIFGWSQIGYGVQRDWLRCAPDTSFPTVCEWRDRIDGLRTPFLIGEMQPWVGQGPLGGKIARATYDTYGGFGWATTSWAYKVFTNNGGEGAGQWGMVTNKAAQSLLVKADTFTPACNNWDSTFADACVTGTKKVTINGTTPARTMYLSIKSGACCGGALDVVYDSISLVNDATGQEMIVNGGFGSNAGWSRWIINGASALDFNYTANTPTGGSGPGLRMSGAADSGGGVYQAIELVPGQTYTLSGVFKNTGSMPNSSWAEIYLMPFEPVAGQDFTGAAVPNVNLATAELSAIEDLFRSFATTEYDVHEDLLFSLTSKQKPTIFTLPARPTGLAAIDNDTSIQLQWTANSQGDLTGYNVYRGSVRGNYTRLAHVMDALYVDTTLVPGQQYFYAVTATDPEDESFLSEVVRIAGDPQRLPGQVQAESFVDMQGVQTETSTDAGGGLNVGFIDFGDWFEYTVHVQTAGMYTLAYRLASDVGSTGFQLLLDGAVIDTQAVPDTGGWQNWVTLTKTMTLPAGLHTLRFSGLGGGGWNLNWFSFQLPQTIPAPIEAEGSTAMSAFQTEATVDAGSGSNVGFTNPGDWLE